MSAYAKESAKTADSEQHCRDLERNSLSALSDIELATRIVKGDKEAFAEILHRYEGKVYRLAYRMTGSVADAEDLTQDIFLAIYRSLPRFRGDSSLSTWIYRVAMNHCMDFRRRTRLESLSLDENLLIVTNSWQENPLEAATKEELGREVEAALARLAPHHREVVILHELHGLTYGEVAEVLQIPVGTVKSRLSNAFRQLRELLRDYLEEQAED